MSDPVKFQVSFPAAVVASVSVTPAPSTPITLPGVCGASVSLAGITRLEVIQPGPPAAVVEVGIGPMGPIGPTGPQGDDASSTTILASAWYLTPIRSYRVVPNLILTPEILTAITIDGVPSHFYFVGAFDAPYDIGIWKDNPEEQAWASEAGSIWWADGKYFVMWGGFKAGLWYAESPEANGTDGLTFIPYLGTGLPLEGLFFEEYPPYPREQVATPWNIATTCAGTFTLAATAGAITGNPAASFAGQLLRQYNAYLEGYDWYVADTPEPETRWSKFVPVTGPAGADGAQGPSGADGAAGANAEHVILTLAAYLALPPETQLDGRWYVIPKT